VRRDKSAKSRQKWRAIIIADGRRPPGSEIVFGIIGIGIDVEIDGVYVFETGRRTPTKPQRDRGAGAGN